MRFSKDTMMLLFNAIDKHGSIDLPAHGHSMFPLINEGEICRFESCDGSLLKKGDIALFHSWNGQLVAHRFYRHETIRQRPCLVFKGDTNWGPDEPVVQEQLIGKLVRIQKRNTIVHVTDGMVKLWSKIIVSFPFLSLLLKLCVIPRRFHY